MTPPSGKSTTEFLCSARVSRCCGRTVTRICTTGQPDKFRCAACGATTTENVKKEKLGVIR